MLRSLDELESKKNNQGWRSGRAIDLFKMDDGTYIILAARPSAAECGVQVFSHAPEAAARWVKDLSARYRRRVRKTPEKSTFSVLSISETGPDTTDVEITRAYAMEDDALRLLYGDAFLPWENELTAAMKKHDTGTLIFQGPPGTGKTTFIRHLVDKLKKTHRFYYLPVTHEELLTSPRMVNFWARENRVYDKLKKVIILEDAEALLERGPHGRSGAIANLLNIADGLLGEFLKVQLLCTVNCEIGQLDEAVVRPGRLIGYREFPRLSPEQAARIAAKHGRELPGLPDYALSDIFGAKLDITPKPASRRRVFGFAATESLKIA
ncbi:MAG: AAA family ATPase [Opitutaceae bacterium]|nr:AAA family ATPase [Opitutaceae bacterium]